MNFVPCTVEEFEETERRVADGSYVYNVVGYQKFSVATTRLGRIARPGPRF